MSDNIRFGIDADDRASARIEYLKRQIDSLKSSIDALNRSQYAGVPGISDKLTADLQNAQRELQNLQSQALQTFANVEGFSTRAIAAMRGIPDAVKPATRELSELDNITRAGSRNAYVSFQTMGDAIANISPKAKITAQELEAAFGGRVLTGARALRQEGEKLGGGFLDNARVIQHAFGIADSAARGARGQMASSFGAMIRDSGLFKVAVESLSGPWAAVAAAGVGALGILGYAAEQAYQRFRSISDAAGSLALGGLGDQTTMLASQFDRLRSVGDEYAGTTRKIQEAAAGLPATALEVAESLNKQATAIAGLTRGDPAKIFDELTKAAQKSPEALAELLTHYYKLQGVVDSTGLTFVQHAKALGNTSEAYRFVTTQAEGFRQKEIEAGTAARRNQTQWLQNALALAGLAEAGDSTSEAVSDLADKLRAANEPAKALVSSTTNLSQAERELGVIISETNGYLENRRALLTRLEALQSAMRGVGGAEMLVPPGTEQALADVGALARSAPGGPAEQERHRQALDAIHAEAQARRADLDAQLKAAQDATQETIRYRAEILMSTKQMSREEATAEALKSTEVKEAQQREAIAAASVADQKVRISIAADRAIIANEQVGSAARIAAQEDIIRRTQEQVTAGRASQEELAQAETQLGTLKRQEANRSFQEFRDQTRAMVETAEGSASKINEAYQQLWQKAIATNQLPATFAQINREWLRDLRSAQTQAFAASEQYESSLERIDRLRLAQAKAGLDAQVASHQISKDQAARAEADLSAKIFAEEERRVQASIDADNTTAAQKAKLYEHLAELYEKDAEKQLDAQKRITQAIEAENAKREKSFSNMFDSLGSGLETFITAGLTRSQTRDQALQAFGRTIISSLVKETGTLASDYAGRAIGPSLGLTAEQSKGGLGSVLGTALFDALGLKKETPAGADVSTKLSASVDAQTKAAELNSKASQTMLEAAEALKSFAGRGGEGAAAAAPAAGARGSGVQGKQLADDVFSATSGTPSGTSTSTAFGRYKSPTTGEYKSLDAVMGDLGIPTRDITSGPGYPSGTRGSFDARGNPIDVNSLPPPRDTENAPDFTRLNAAQKQLTDTVNRGASAQDQADAAVLSSSSTFQTNARDVSQASQATEQFSNSARTASGAVGGGGGGGGSGLVGGVSQLTGALGTVSPVARGLSTIISTTTSVVSGFSAVLSATSATASAGSVAKTGLLGLGLFGLERGGVIPSAAGGMIAGGGQMAILHPREMVLPAHLSVGLQNMINRGTPGGGNTANLTYHANVTGYHPYASRSSFEGLLRTHGDALFAHAENWARNNFRI